MSYRTEGTIIINNSLVKSNLWLKNVKYKNKTMQEYHFILNKCMQYFYNGNEKTYKPLSRRKFLELTCNIHKTKRDRNHKIQNEANQNHWRSLSLSL